MIFHEEEFVTMLKKVLKDRLTISVSIDINVTRPHPQVEVSVFFDDELISEDSVALFHGDF